ncbi:MAG: hydroxylamine reductase, partial [Candidatus Aureabacteria bacterium]|nr:hydroxylamine reductase [Candidatus Auribacterota bacterium]
MFCYQCQETIKNTGCTKAGACGKKEQTANLQDLLVYVLKGIAVYAQKAKEKGIKDSSAGLFTARALFATITNTNFNDDRIIALIREGLTIRSELKEKSGVSASESLHDAALWYADNLAAFYDKAKEVGVLSTENEDVRSLRELLIYGLKGLAAYTDHAAVLGFQNEEIYEFIM